MDIKSLIQNETISYPAGFEGLLTPCNWITDAVVSACFCKNGICNLDYHGKQPVSRNAKMAVSSYADPVIRFGTTMQSGFSPFTVTGYEAAAWANRFEITHNGSPAGEMFAMTEGKSVFLGVRLISPAPFTLRFDANKLYTNVHGRMKWSRVARTEKLLFEGENRFKLIDWVNEKGAFLLPVKYHDRVFGKGITDVNNLDVLPPVRDEIKTSEELFIDSLCCMVIDSAQEYSKTEDGGVYFMRFKPAENGWLYFSISYGDEPDAALAESARIRKEYRIAAQNQSLRYRKVYERQPEITVKGFPQLSEAFKWLPRYAESVKQSSTGMTRASASSYYWVWGWDNLVTAHEMSKWGDTEGQRAIIRFFLSNRWVDGSTPHRFDRNYEIIQTMQFGATDCLLISLVYQHYCDTRDNAFLKECYSHLLELWQGLYKKSDSRGLIRGLGFYPDNPKSMGRRENGFTAIETGAFFLAARVMTRISSTCGDESTARQAADICRCIQQNYMPNFFDKEQGTLLDGIDEKGVKNQTHPLYAHIAAYNRYGAELFYPTAAESLPFFMNNYLTDMGIRGMPEWDRNAKTESVHHSWYLHWDIHAMKLMRLGALTNGDMRQIQNIIKQYAALVSRMWESYRGIMELVELDTAENGVWKQYGQAWNLNCASGLYRTLIESVCGVWTDCGKITVLPQPDGPETEIKGLWACGARWDFNRSGRGSFSHLLVDGNAVYGTCTLPGKWMTPGEHRITAVYSESASYPCIFDYPDGEIRKTRKTDTGIAAELDGSGNLLILSENPPVVRFDGKPLASCKVAGNLYSIEIENGGTIDF